MAAVMLKSGFRLLGPTSINLFKASTRRVSHYYGTLERYIKGSAGAKQEPLEATYMDQLRAQHLLKVKFHIGHQKRNLNKNVTGAIYGFRHNIAIYDITKTWKSIRTVFYAFAELAQYRSSFYLLAPNPNIPLRPLIERMRKEYPFKHNEFSSLYMVGYSDKKWIDGLFSNWKVTYQFMQHVREVLDKKPTLKKFRRYARYLRGVENVDLMANIVPDFILVFAHDRGAIHEAKNLDIPLVGMVDTNNDPTQFLYPVYGNDDSVEALEFMMEVVKRGVEEGRKREHEAFATLMLQKIKSKLDPKHALLPPNPTAADLAAGDADGGRIPYPADFARSLQAMRSKQPAGPLSTVS